VIVFNGHRSAGPVGAASIALEGRESLNLVNLRLIDNIVIDWFKGLIPASGWVLDYGGAVEGSPYSDPPPSLSGMG
jgi:hypothetical protein